MSASQYRGQLERKRKQRADAENRSGAYRTKESTKRAEAAKARQAAAKTKSEATARTKLRQADRREYGSRDRRQRGRSLADEGRRICKRRGRAAVNANAS